jgi:hypothetical protein
LGLQWTVGPVLANHGKPVTSATFESTAWLAEILIWETGETDVSTVCIADGRIINKHYDVASVTDLDTVVDEVLRLIRDGEIPPDAFAA